MALIDSKTSKPWSPGHVNSMLGHIRQACVKELRRRDQAAGIPEDGKVYTVTGDEGGNAREHLRVDRDLAGKKSTGRELRMLTERKWAEFCAVPRHELHYAKVLGLDANPRAVAARAKHVAMVRGEVPDELAAAVEIPGSEPVKNLRGSPLRAVD